MSVVFFFLSGKKFFLCKLTNKIDFYSGIFGIIKLLLVQLYIPSVNDK